MAAPSASSAFSFEMAREHGDDIGQRDRAFRQRGAFVDQRGREDRFQAAHQAAVIAVDIGVDGVAAVMRLVAIDEVEEHRRGDHRGAVFDGGQNCGVASDDADRRVGVPKSNPAARMAPLLVEGPPPSTQKVRLPVYFFWLE